MTPARTPAGFSPQRVWAMVLRHFYLLKGSWPRLLELIYWPTVQVAMWGFLTTYLARDNAVLAQAAGLFIAAVLLWDVLFRGQLGVNLAFLEEMWSRNLGHLFVSPLRPYEWALSLMIMSFLRTLIGVIGASLLAIPMHHYSIFTMGLPLIAFFVNLIVMGWALGLVVSGLVLRYGQGAESLAWVSVFALLPLSGVYYPIDVLPGWLQTLAWLLPSSYVFEGMRAILIDGIFRTDLIVQAAAINVVYLAAGLAGFLLVFRFARARGLLLQQGE